MKSKSNISSPLTCLFEVNRLQTLHNQKTDKKFRLNTIRSRENHIVGADNPSMVLKLYHPIDPTLRRIELQANCRFSTRRKRPIQKSAFSTPRSPSLLTAILEVASRQVENS